MANPYQATATFGLAQAGANDEARAAFQNHEITLYGVNVPQFDGTTSYGQNYVAHPMEGRQGPISPSGQYKREFSTGQRVTDRRLYAETC